MNNRYRPAATVAIMSVVMALVVSGLAFSLMVGGNATAADDPYNPPQYPPGTPTVTVTSTVPGPTVTSTVPGPTVTVTVTATPSTPPGKPVSCKVKTTNNASKIYVNMGPNQPGNRYYTFRLDVKRGGEWFRYLNSYKTKGKGETRTVNVPKGTYQVKCYGKYGYTDAPVSRSLTIKK
jgi:hypothetical protein